MAITFLNGNWYQIIDDESSDIAEFDSNESRSVVTFLIQQSSILAFINDCLGYAKLQTNSFVTRVIPASHPIFPWMYAYKIVNIQGCEVNGKEVSTLVKDQTTYKDVDGKIPQYVGSYKYYKIAVLFQSRDYNIYSNEQLDPFYQTTSYYMPRYTNAAGDWGERTETYTNRRENWRYVNIKKTMDTQILTYGGGNFWQKSGNNPPAGKPLEAPIPMDQSGNNNIKVTKFNLDVNWFFVPFELTIKNQLWTEAYSKVNLYEFLGHAAGSCLLQKIKVNKYDPYYPFENIDLSNSSSVYDYYTEYNKNQYCDVKFKFSYFNLPSGIKVTPDPASYFPLNCKSPLSSHNMIMSPKDLNWYYVESLPLDAGAPNPKAAPIYWNYDMDRIFTYVEGV